MLRSEELSTSLLGEAYCQLLVEKPSNASFQQADSESAKI